VSNLTIGELGSGGLSFLTQTVDFVVPSWSVAPRVGAVARSCRPPKSHRGANAYLLGQLWPCALLHARVNLRAAAHVVGRASTTSVRSVCRMAASHTASCRRGCSARCAYLGCPTQRMDALAPGLCSCACMQGCCWAASRSKAACAAGRTFGHARRQLATQHARAFMASSLQGFHAKRMHSLCVCHPPTVCMHARVLWRRRFSLARMKRMATAQLPWPLAMVSGMLVGALLYLVKNRPAYNSEVRAPFLGLPLLYS